MLQSLLDLLSRPWLTRTWIIQEAVLSNWLYFMTGSSVIAWPDFGGYLILRDLGIFEYGNHWDENCGMVLAGVDAAVQLYKTKSFQNVDAATSSLVQILIETRYAAVSMPVDKLYGILGLYQVLDGKHISLSSEWVKTHAQPTALSITAAISNLPALHSSASTAGRTTRSSSTT